MSTPSSRPGFWQRLLRRWFSAADPAAPLRRGRSQWVPIRALAPRHKPRILMHLLQLQPDDRYLRFGYPATDEQIQRYVDGLNFGRDEIFGVFNRRLQIVAMAHLAYSVDPQWASCAEFGVSVDGCQRGRGLGTRLFGRALTHARNQGVRLFFIHALSENAPMLAIARKAGARVERDGSETEAYLAVPHATFDSQMRDLWQEGLAELDYQLKLQARQFRQWLATVQEIRRGVRKARHHQDPH
jgi:RimJ/RimL family protein N-acetyltransferase